MLYPSTSADLQTPHTETEDFCSPNMTKTKRTEPHSLALPNAAKRLRDDGRVLSLYLKGWIIQHQRLWEQMCWWRGISLQRRRLFGLLITASLSDLSLWWAKYKVLQVQTRFHSYLKPRLQNSWRSKGVITGVTNDYCIKTYSTHIYYSTIRAKEWTACWWLMKARRPGIKPHVS